MLLYYVRHGDPIYDPDSLTPLGERQAEAVAKRLARYGLDEIYVSSSQRAKDTAKPTCEILKMEPVELDWANEGHAWRDFSVEREDGGRSWCFQLPSYQKLFNCEEIRSLGDNWYDYPGFSETNFKNGMLRISNAADDFFAQQGFRHDRKEHIYITEKPNNKRIAIFAHQGFGLAFLSCILDIPYPMVCTHFDITPTGMTVIEFSQVGEYVLPKVLMHSSDSHIYREGLPLRYNGVLKI